MLDRSLILDPDLVSRLRIWRIAGPPSPHPQRGIHPSPRRGASLEFSEHTEYTPGENIRDIDWKVYAKTDRYYLKRYEDERLQRSVIVLDASASMAFGAESTASLKGSKFHTAARIASSLASLLLRQGDAVGLMLAGAANSYLPPRSGRAQIEAIVDLIGSVEPSGKANLSETLGRLAERLTGGSAVFLIADFLDAPAEDLETLALLAGRGMRPRIVHILHRAEAELPYENPTRFLDMEGPDALTLDPEAVRQAYIEEIRKFVNDVSLRADRMAAPHEFMISDEDPAIPLSRLIQMTGVR